MKLRDFLTLKRGSGILLSGNVYNPYINYSWSQTLTVGGNQQIKDTGTAGLNLQQFFGQGCWFNGIDMSIGIGSVPVSNSMTLAYSFVPVTNSRILGRSTWDSFVGFSTVSATEGVVRCRFTGTDTVFTYRLTLGVPYSIILVLKPDVIDLWVNGILRESVSHTYTFAHPLEFIGRNSTAFANCVIKDIYVYNKHLTQTEIEKYNNQPNQFFMDSLEDSSCILAMPLCEKDGFVRNYKSYSEGSNFDGVTLASQTVGTGNSITQNNNVFNITNVISTGVTYYPLVKFNPTVFDSTLYYMEIEVKCITGTLKVNSLESTQRTTANEVLTAGKSKVYTNISMFANIGGQKGVITLDGLNYPTFTAEVTLKNIRQLTSIYPITNYLTTCRTNAQRLPYGLQTSGFKRDTNGLILSKSNFLEVDGVGYGNTGNYIDSLTDFSMEFIGLFKTSSVEQAHGVGYYNTYNRVTFSINSSGKLFSRCGGTAFHYSNVSLFDVSNYLTLTFVQSTKIFKLYLNGNYVGQVSNANFISTIGDYTIGSQGSATYAVNGDIRLFKVHNKVLTQEEVSKNFNKYQAQGLLNE